MVREIHAKDFNSLSKKDRYYLEKALKNAIVKRTEVVRDKERCAYRVDRSTTIPKEYIDNSWDFGFTAVDEETVATPMVVDVKSTVDEETRLTLLKLEQLIMPLLVNLMKNPDKDYIHWPNRTPMIEKQIDKILAITRP